MNNLNPLPSLMQDELNAILSELQKKYNESQKRCNEIKESVTRILRLVSKSQTTVKPSDLKNYDFVLPFLLCCKTNNPKLINPALSYLQRLTLHTKIQEEIIPPVITELSVLALTDQCYQVKVMQCFLALYADCGTSTSTVITKAVFSTCLSVLGNNQFKMREIVFATTKQLATCLFDKAANFAKERSSRSCGDSTELAVDSDAVAVFKDLCALLNGTKPVFLELESISQIYGVALLESILSGNVEYFKEHESIFPTIKYALCPFVIGSLSESGEATGMYYRVVRLIRVIVKNYCSGLAIETEILLSTLRGIMVLPQTPMLNKILAIEVICYLISDPEVVELMYSNCRSDDKNCDLCSSIIPSPCDILLCAVVSPDIPSKINKLLSMDDLPRKLEDVFTQDLRANYLDALERSDSVEISELCMVPLSCKYVHVIVKSLSRMNVLVEEDSDKEYMRDVKIGFLTDILSSLDEFYSNTTKLPIPQNNLILLLNDLYSLSAVVWKNKSVNLHDKFVEMLFRIYKCYFLRASSVTFYHEKLPKYIKTLICEAVTEVRDVKTIEKKDKKEDIYSDQAVVEIIFLVEKLSSFSSSFRNVMTVSHWESLLEFMEIISNTLQFTYIISKDKYKGDQLCTPISLRRYRNSGNNAQKKKNSSDENSNTTLEPMIVHHLETLAFRIMSETDSDAILRIIKAISSISSKFLDPAAVSNVSSSVHLNNKEMQLKCLFYTKFILGLSLSRPNEVTKISDEDPYYIISSILSKYSNSNGIQKVWESARRAHASIISSIIFHKSTAIYDPKLYLRLVASVRLMGLHENTLKFEYTGPEVWDMTLSLPVEAPADTYSDIHKHIWALKVLRVLSEIPEFLVSQSAESFKIIEDYVSIYSSLLCNYCNVSCVFKPFKLPQSLERNYCKMTHLIYNIIKDTVRGNGIPKHFSMMERARCILLRLSLHSANFSIVMNFVRLLYVMTQVTLEAYVNNSDKECKIDVSAIRECYIKDFSARNDVLSEILNLGNGGSESKTIVYVDDFDMVDKLLRNLLHSLSKYTLHYLEDVRSLSFKLLLNLGNKYVHRIPNPELRFYIVDTLLPPISYMVGQSLSHKVELSYYCDCATKSEDIPGVMNREYSNEVMDYEDIRSPDDLVFIILETSELIRILLDTLMETHSRILVVCEEVINIVEVSFHSQMQDISVSSLHALGIILSSNLFKNCIFESDTTKVCSKILNSFANMLECAHIDSKFFPPTLLFDEKRQNKMRCTRYQTFILIGVFIKAYKLFPDELFISNFDTAATVIINSLIFPVMMTITGAPQFFYEVSKIEHEYICVPMHPYKKVEEFIISMSTDKDKCRLVPEFMKRIFISLYSIIKCINEAHKNSVTDTLLSEYLLVNYVSIVENSMKVLTESLEFIEAHPNPYAVLSLSSTIDNLIGFTDLDIQKIVMHKTLGQPKLVEISLHLMDRIVSTLIACIGRDYIAEKISRSDISYMHEKIIAPYRTFFQNIRHKSSAKNDICIGDDIIKIFLDSVQKTIAYFCQTSNLSTDSTELHDLVNILVNGSSMCHNIRYSSCDRLDPELPYTPDTNTANLLILRNKRISTGCYSIVSELCSRYKYSNERHVHATSKMAACTLYEKCKSSITLLIDDLRIYGLVPLEDTQYTELLLMLETVLSMKVIPCALSKYFPEGNNTLACQIAANSELAHLLLLAPELSSLCEMILHSAEHINKTYMFEISTHGASSKYAAIYFVSRKCLEIIWKELGLRG